MKGKFFVIDGMDGTGKTEQTDELIKRMQREGFPVDTISFPRYGKPAAAAVGEYLEKYKKGSEFGPMTEVSAKQASIFYAIDRFGARRGMIATLDAGTHLVANRYVASNMGHQGSKIDDLAERMSFYHWNDKLEFSLYGVPRPDLNIILHVPVDVALTRIDSRGLEKDAHENRAHLEAAERTYFEIARTFPGFCLIEGVEDGRILSIPEVHEKIWKVVRPLLD